jgi:hypothetical protein
MLCNVTRASGNVQVHSILRRIHALLLRPCQKLYRHQIIYVDDYDKESPNKRRYHSLRLSTQSAYAYPYSSLIIGLSSGVGFEVLIAVRVKSSVFRNITLTLLATCFMLLSCLAYSTIMMMEMTCSSETSVDFKQGTRHDATSEKIELPLVGLREHSSSRNQYIRIIMTDESREM